MEGELKSKICKTVIGPIMTLGKIEKETLCDRARDPEIRHRSVVENVSE